MKRKRCYDNGIEANEDCLEGVSSNALNECSVLKNGGTWGKCRDGKLSKFYNSDISICEKCNGTGVVKAG